MTLTSNIIFFLTRIAGSLVFIVVIISHFFIVVVIAIRIIEKQSLIGIV